MQLDGASADVRPANEVSEAGGGGESVGCFSLFSQREEKEGETGEDGEMKDHQSKGPLFRIGQTGSKG